MVGGFDDEDVVSVVMIEKYLIDGGCSRIQGPGRAVVSSTPWDSGAGKSIRVGLGRFISYRGTILTIGNSFEIVR